MEEIQTKTSSFKRQPITRKCQFIGDLPKHIKKSYDRLALIDSDESMVGLIPEDENTLVVCCNWLAWHRLIENRVHAVHYEFGTYEWLHEGKLNTELYMHANDWILNQDGEDPTKFHGVSIGRLFGAEMSMAVLNFYRINIALRGLINRFQPKELLFYNFKYDINHLTKEMRRDLIAKIAKNMGVGFKDCNKLTTEEEFKTVKYYRHEESRNWRSFFGSIYATILDRLTNVRRMPSPLDKRVLMLINSNISEPLVREYSKNRVVPILLARTVPKKWNLIKHCIKNGILLINPNSQQLSRNDRIQLDIIRKKLENLCEKKGEPALSFMYKYVKEILLSDNALYAAGQEILTAKAVLQKFCPSRVVVDGVRSRRHLSYIEQAGLFGVSVDYIWHAPLTPHSIRMGALGGDPRQPVFVNRCLSWGEVNDEWLTRVGSKVSILRTGSPLRNKHVISACQNTKKTEKSPEACNVMILQYGFGIFDLAGLNTTMYSTFVHLVRRLRKLGYKNIIFKMHPGPGRWEKKYFEQINDFFALNCKVLRLEPFHECLNWADIVIGPCITGAIFDTLSYGKPYYALLLPPNHLVDKHYFREFPLIESLDELENALKCDNYVAGQKLLNSLYSTTDIPNPSAQFWKIMNETAIE